MILACIALAIATAALVYVIRNNRKIKQLQRQTWADISLTEIYNARARYYMQRAAEVRARTRRPV